MKWDCAIGTPEEDHDWRYDGGDDSVGISGAWVCRFCGKVDGDRDPPSDPDEDAYEREEPMSNEFEEVYIGDGVYARWDGFSVLLKTERDNGTHYIYLEPAHVEYIVKLMEQPPRIAKRRTGQG